MSFRPTVPKYPKVFTEMCGNVLVPKCPKVFTSCTEMSWDTRHHFGTKMCRNVLVPKCPATPADSVIMLDNYCAMLEAKEEQACTQCVTQLMHNSWTAGVLLSLTTLSTSDSTYLLDGTATEYDWSTSQLVALFSLQSSQATTSLLVFLLYKVYLCANVTYFVFYSP